ncbi:MAG: hypothetical protein SNJ63_04820 [Sphingomonadaceae bacterium]
MTKVLFLVVLAVAVGVALIRGGREERVAAGAILAATGATPVMQSHAFAGPETGILIVDLVLLGVLGWLALGSRCFWPIWAAGFQMGSLGVHLAAARLPEILPAVYAETLVIWSYPVLAALLLGTLVEAQVRNAR